MDDTKTKNIVLIGETANGKSKLIQQVLKYAGELGRAKTVGVGAGNISTTQVCKSWRVTVPLKEHFLVDARTKRRITPTKDTESDEVERRSKFLGRSIILSILDTPGLSDSGNSEETDARFEAWFSVSGSKEDSGTASAKAQTISSKDEGHKVSILNALWQVNQVHAICFVVKRSTTFAGSFQKSINSLFKIFNQSFRHLAFDVEYHIIHTSTGLTQRFSSYQADRESAFKRYFPSIRASHHFMDNLPDQDDPIALHFSENAHSKWFQQLENSQGCSVLGLVYPKEPGHKNTDQQLLYAIKGRTQLYDSKIQELRPHIEIQTKMRKLHGNELSEAKKALNEHDRKIKKLDSDDHQELPTSMTFSAPSKPFWGTSPKTQSLSVDVPIARGMCIPVDGGSWSPLEIAGRKVTATLHSTSIFYGVTGTVKLFACIRDIEKTTLNNLQASRIPKLERYQKYQKSCAQLDEDIKLAKIRLNRYTNMQLELQKDRVKILKTNNSALEPCFSLVSMSQRCHYFTVNNISAAAKGYELQAKIPKSELPDITNQVRWRREIEARVQEQRRRIGSRKMALNALDDQINQKRQRLEDITNTDISEKILMLVSDQDERVNAIKHAALSPYTRVSMSRQLTKLQSRIKSQAGQQTQLVRAELEEELERLKTHKSILGEVGNGLDTVLRSMEEQRSEWMLERRWLELWVNAAEEVMEEVQKDEFSFGTWLIASRSMLDHGDNPFMVVVIELWEALRAADKFAGS